MKNLLILLDFTRLARQFTDLRPKIIRPYYTCSRITYALQVERGSV